MQWTLKQLETFVWVAKLGNFRKTAERLNTTQPNISARIAGLETVLGTRLFERNAGSVVLTAKGSVLLGHAERVLVVTEEFSAQSGQAAQQAGVIRVGATELVAQTWFGRFVKKLRGAFANVVVDVAVDLSVNLRDDLTERRLDLAILNGPVPDQAIRNVALGAAPLIWVAAPDLPGPLGQARDLARYPILTHARNTRPYAQVADFFRDAAVPSVRIVPSSSMTACLQMTLDGLGVATLPEPLVRDHLAHGTLRELTLDWVPDPLVFTASYAASPASALVRAAARLAHETTEWLGSGDTSNDHEK